jgi:Ser/Thr protein kinase RdoA (MazF antagonist)
LTFFDFDCGGFGYRAYEAAVFRWGRLHNAKDTADEGWQAFLDGYATRRRLAETDLAAVPLFVVARQIWLMGLHCANADDWGARQWLTTRFFDQEIGRLADWMADLPGGGPVWACRRP